MNTISPRIRVKEVAQILGCSVSTIWAWVKNGHIPALYRIGARFSYWLRSDIEAIANGSYKYQKSA
jgi:excisionase family DNA binding protein